MLVSPRGRQSLKLCDHSWTVRAYLIMDRIFQRKLVPDPPDVAVMRARMHDETKEKTFRKGGLYNVEFGSLTC
jgi:hypothetical protein